MPKKNAESSRSLVKGQKGEKSPKKKKKKSKDGVVKPESSMTLMSTESKAKKKKPKSSSSLGGKDKKKPKKSSSSSKKSKRHLVIHKDEDKDEDENNNMINIEEGNEQLEDDDADMKQPQQQLQDQISKGESISSNADAKPPQKADSAAAASLEDDINDDMDMMEDSQIFEAGPPIGEILAMHTAEDDDDVSDIGDAIQDDPVVEIIDGVEVIYNPDDTDICFDDRHHPGTKDWIIVIRECLEKFVGQEYSPPVYKAIKKKLKGRRFLVRTRRTERTSWREATKPEVIELFGECFNEERRRDKEGITDDDSGIDSSLQNSAAQSEMSLSVADILDTDEPEVNVNGTATKEPLPTPTPTSAPTPRMSNHDNGEVEIKSKGRFDFHSSPRRTISDTALAGHTKAARLKTERGQSKRSLSSGEIITSDTHLLMAMREIEGAEDYARPFDDVTLLQQGIAAEEKLNTLLTLADSSRTVALKAELDKLEDLAKRMRYASMAPLLDILTKIERHVTDYYQSLTENNASSSSLQESLMHLQQNHKSPNGVDKTTLSKQPSMDRPPTSPRRPLEADPDTDVENSTSHRVESSDSNRVEKDANSHQGARHRRTINVSSEHGQPSSDRHALNSLEGSAQDSSPLKSPGRSDLGLNHSAVSLSMDDDEFDDDGLSHDEHRTSDIDDLGSASTNHEKLDSGRRIGDPDDVSSDPGHEDYELQLADKSDLESEDLSNRKGSNREKYGDPDSSSQAEGVEDSYNEMVLGGSSSVGSQGSEPSEYSGQLETEKRHDAQEYERSYRTADLGGSYREMQLAGMDSAESFVKENESGLETDDDELYDDDAAEEDGEVYDDDADELEDGGAAEIEDAEEDHDGEGEGVEGDFALPDENGHILEVKRDYGDDDLSSMGRSMPGLYGSDSEDEDEEEYEEYEVDYEEEEEEDEDKSEGSDTSKSDSDESGTKTEPKEEKANPKVEQFFDRLQHFFEVRRKVDERAELMDSSGKFQSIKVKLHSGGILKKNGKYKKEYQQHDLRNKIVRTLDDLYDAAELAQLELKRLLEQLIAEIKGLDGGSIIVVPLKQRNKAFEKAQEEYFDRKPGPPESWLYDIVRGSVMCKSYKQMNDVNKWLGKNAHIVTSKNRFLEPAFNGYRDLLYHVSIPYKDDLAHICEIQVHLKDMKALDEQFGMPKHYEYFRSAFAGPWRTQDQILEDLGMLNKYGEIGGQCMVKLLKSKDPDQLRLFARLCRDKLDEFDRALELYRRILLLQEGRDDHEDIADTYMGLGLVLGALGEVDESLLNLEKALAIKESIQGTDHLEVAHTYTEIGHMLSQKGDYAGALKKFRDAMKVREKQLGREHFLVINSLQDIGCALRDTGDFRSSEAELRRALKIQESVLGDIHPDVAVTRSMLGTTLCELGDFSKAMEEHRLALTIRETVLGKNHPLTAHSHTNIGIVLRQKGDYEVAEWRYRKALRIQEAVKGKDDEDCAVSLTHLGEVLKRKGDYDGAIKSIKRAIKMREKNLGMDHPVSAGSHLDLGQVYLKKRKFDQALQEFRKAKVVRESFLGQRHPDTAVAYNAVGNVLSLKGEHDAALNEHKRALAIFEATLGKTHPATATGYQCLADALFAKGDKDDSLIEHRKALAVRANILSKDHPDTAVSCARIGKLLSEKGDLVGALVAYRQALAITVGLCGEEHPESATARIEVGAVLAAQGDLEEALDEVQVALEIKESSLGKDHTDTAQALGVMGTLHSMLGEFTEAQEFHKKSLSILERKLGKKNALTKAARQKLMKAVEKEEEKVVLL